MNMTKTPLVLALRCLLGCGLVAGSSMAFAQAVPGAGDVLRDLPQPGAISTPQPALPVIGQQTFEPPLRQLPQGGASVEVKGINFVGNREISQRELAALVAEDLGQRLTLAELEEIASRLTRHYRTQGYFVARVYIPAQEVKDGVITFRAVEGNYGAFHLTNQSLVRDSIVQGMLDDVKKYDIVSLDTLERAMLIINDTPGSQVVRADVMPGEAVGTSDFAVDTEATRRHQGYLLADNYGSKATGRERLSFNWDWNSPTGSGDRLSLSGLGSVNGDLLNGRLGYSTVLSASGWRGEAALSQTDYTLGSRFADLDASGTATGFDLGATYPIRRIRAQTIEFGINYAFRDLQDEVRVTDTQVKKRSQAVSARLRLRDEGFLLGRDGLTEAEARLTSGVLDIRDAATLALDQASGGADTDGQFNKLNLQLSRVTLLPASFSLTASLRHQMALGNKNLDSSERMGISGASAVRAYPSSEASGTDATLLGLELSRPLPALAGMQQQVSGFGDWGQARTLRSDSWESLSGVGLGWTLRSNNGLLLKTQWAYKLDGDAASENEGKSRLLVQAGWIF